jgi:tetratricopeptide (TPR) repeat protein
MSKTRKKEKIIQRPQSVAPLPTDWPAGLKRVSIFLLIATFVVFSPALKNELVSWDDYAYIRDNTIIHDLSFQKVKEIFSTKTHVVGNYHPLTVLTLALEYKCVGDSPFIYHFDNLLLHLLNVLLIIAISWLLLHNLQATLIIAALYALHPMRVESVVWAAERKDVLYAFFFFSAFYQYLKFNQEGRKKKIRILSVAVLFLLSLLSKGQAVVFPLCLVLADHWYDNQPGVKRLVFYLPFFLLSALFGWLAIQAQASSLTDVRLSELSYLQRGAIAAYGVIVYLAKLVFPLDLCCFYGYPLKSEWWKVYASVVVFLLLAVLIYRQRKNKPLVFGSLFFIFTILPVLQLLPVGDAVVADRYTYIPFFGLFLIIGHFVSQKFPALDQRSLATYGIVILMLLFAVLSYRQILTWKDSRSLFEQALKVNPDEPVAHNNLGAYYFGRKEYPDAIHHFQECIAHPETYKDLYMAYTNLGHALRDGGEVQKSAEAYSKAIDLQPLFLEAYLGRGMAYMLLKSPEKAITDLDELLRRDPAHVRGWYTIGMAKRDAGKRDEAISALSKAIELKPDYAEAYTNRGNIYYAMGETDKAIDNYDHAINFSPNDGIVFLNRSKAWMTKNDVQRAFEDLQRAEQLNARDDGYKQIVEATLKEQKNKL